MIIEVARRDQYGREVSAQCVQDGKEILWIRPQSVSTGAGAFYLW